MLVVAVGPRLEQVMTEGTLRLTQDEDQSGDILPFERRQSPRRSISGEVTTLQASEDSVRKFSSLALRDISEAGLRAVSSEPIEVNASILLLFQPHGPEGGHDTTGQVVRCKATSHGYEIGIRFQDQAVAA